MTAITPRVNVVLLDALFLATKPASKNDFRMGENSHQGWG
jgi:hypothetical protein